MLGLLCLEQVKVIVAVSPSNLSLKLTAAESFQDVFSFPYFNIVQSKIYDKVSAAQQSIGVSYHTLC